VGRGCDVGALRFGFTQLEVVMTKQEIDEMMKDLPSQRGWQEETLLEKIIGGVAFTLLVLILCFI
jgi:hypothetical protein